MIVDYDDSSSDGSESQNSDLERKTKSSSMAVSGEDNDSAKRRKLKMQALAKRKMLSKRNPKSLKESDFRDIGFDNQPTQSSLKFVNHSQ